MELSSQIDGLIDYLSFCALDILDEREFYHRLLLLLFYFMYICI